jgi:hypothetical protein
MKTLSFPEVDFTQVRSSSSFIFNTINQLDLIFLTSSVNNFLTVHFFVTKNKYLFLSSEISIIEEISSFLSNESRLIIACHFVVL